MLIVFRPTGRDHDSQNQYYFFGDTKIPQIIQEIINSFQRFCGEISNTETEDFELFGKDGGRQILTIRHKS